MKVLVLNRGSSSIKYELFGMGSREVIAQGGIEKISLKDSFLKLILPNGEKKILEKDTPEHAVGVEFILDTLVSPKYGTTKSLEEINTVGHRMVHGGERFNKSALLTGKVLEAFAACNDPAPPYNPANLKRVDAITVILPNVPQIGVFDTAFHQAMPEYAYLYAIPYKLYKKYGVRHYSFHGISHRYVSQRVCEYLGTKPEELRLIICHIGNDGSIAAIEDGKYVDTSIGLVPLEDLVMDIRSGDIDAGAIAFIMDKGDLTTTGISNLLSRKNGMAGMMSGSSDMCDLEAVVAKGDPWTALTEQIYFCRIKKYIGVYAATLGGVDVILFTGGVGKDQATCHTGVCEGLEFMGVKLGVKRNRVRGEEAIIPAGDSRMRIVVIPTDEELLTASDTTAILDK